MFNCKVCNKEIPRDVGIRVNADGDFVCSDNCKDQYFESQEIEMDTCVDIPIEERYNG